MRCSTRERRVCGSRKFRWGREAPGAIKAAFHNQGMLAIFARNSSLRLCQAAVHSSREYTLAVDRKGKSENYAVLLERPFQVFRFSGDPALVPMVQATNFRYRNNRTQFDSLYRSGFRTILLQG